MTTMKIENAKAAEENAEVKKFEVGKIYEVIRHGNSIYGEPELVGTGEIYEVVKHTAKFVTFKHTETGEIITRKFEVSEDDSEISKDTEFAVIGSLKFLSADNVVATAEETDPNAEIIACIDEYSVDVDAAAEVEEVNAEPSEKKILQAKIAEIKNRKHKSCIDWDAVYNDFRVEEIFNLQRDFKKFLKLGEMKRAETVFENLKHCFKAA